MAALPVKARFARALRGYCQRPRIVLELALLAALLSAAVIVLMAVGSAQVLAEDGSEALPLVYLLLAAVSVPLASGISAALCRWPVSRISGAASLASLLLALGLRLAVGFELPGASLATCIAAYALEIVFDTLFWLSASQHLPTLELKRHTPFLAAAFGLGGIFAGFAATLFCEFFSGRDLLLLDAAFFGLCFLQYRRIARADSHLEENEADDNEPGVIEALKATCSVVRTFPITGALALSVLLMAALFCLQDYLAMGVYEQSFDDADALSSFMAMVYAGHQAAELLILAVCGRLILERAGPVLRNLIFPLTTCAGLLALLASWSLPAAVFVHANVIALSNAVFEPVKTLDFAAVPYRVSAQVRVLVDGVVYPLGVALSALALLWLQSWADPATVLSIALALAVLFVAVSALVGAWFLPHLLRSLRLRAISPSEYARAESGRLFSAADIRQLLNHPDPEARQFGQTLAERLAPHLLPAFDQEQSLNRGDDLPIPEGGLSKPFPAREIAADAATRPLLLRRHDYSLVGETPPHCGSRTSSRSRSHNRRRSDAGIWRLAVIQHGHSIDRIHEVGRGLEDRSRAVRRAAAALLATFGSAALPAAALRLRSDRPEVAEAAIWALGGIGSRKAVRLLQDHLQPLFERAHLNLDALNALRELAGDPNDDTRRALEAWLIDSNRRIVRRVFIVKSALGNARDVKFLHALTRAREPRTRSNAFEALINMRTKRFIQPVMPLLESLPQSESAAGIGSHIKNLSWPAPPLAIERAAAFDPWARLLAAQLTDSAQGSRRSAEEDRMLDLVLFLKTTPLFRAVALEDIAGLARMAEAVTQDAGEKILEAHDLVRHVYVIHSGEVELIHGPAVVETLGPRQTFGEAAILGEDRAALCCRAAAPTVLLRFPLSIIADLVAENPDVLASLLVDLQQRLTTLHGRLARVETDLTRARCADDGIGCSSGSAPSRRSAGASPPGGSRETALA